MKIRNYLTIALLTLALLTVAEARQQAAACPMHEQHAADKSKAGEAASHNHAGHFDGVNTRGDHAMGFDHLKTTHHFLLFADGGAIDVGANDAQDAASVEQIRSHLRHIAMMFSDGDFSTPMFIHDRVPPGVDAMKRLKAVIAYRYEETERGARVRVSTRNDEARAAIHGFLRFQIEDHQTGDPLEVSSNR
jgi:hypothetical protein